MAIALAACTLAACGSGDDGGQQLSFTVDSEGKVSGPSSAETGLAEIALVNDGESRNASLQLIRTEGEHSADEVAKVFAVNFVRVEALPDWFLSGGGVGSTPPGEERSVTQVLQPGTYYAVNIENPYDPQAIASFEVTGEESDETVEGEATVTASEYTLSSEAPLPAGTNEIVFDNVGTQPHHLLASKLKGDATAKDALNFFRIERKRPLDEATTQATTMIEGGESQLVTFELEPGRYALYCLITDREGGPQHAIKGMVSEIEVVE